MKLGHRAGAFISFLDSFTEETILKVEAHSENDDLFSYRLYDCTGTLVAESDEPLRLPDGLVIQAADGEVLLAVPAELGQDIRYRLYSHSGALITCSDGSRTRIFAGLRIVGNRPLAGRPRTQAPTALSPATASD